MSQVAEKLIAAARELADAVDRLKFGTPVTHVYNPLKYAWEPHQMYLRRFGNSRKRVIFFGMNPGPFGMAQTGVPFGEVAMVRDWMGIRAKVAKPALENPRRPVEGFDCSRSEVSGKRLWGLFAQRFGSAERFFAEHFVVNYCPLAFCEASGCNRTPDKLPSHESEPLRQLCNQHLARVLEILEPKWIVGVGKFAEERAREVAPKAHRIGQILHPSPASPAANRDWAGAATAQLLKLGVWNEASLEVALA
ncbi:MAG: single-stranded DNA-binding protein [Verrucomicrobiae bacterium]|nr:single-stranded DNA-binding protein [Verrucomicrobiae bacterium]